MHRNCCTRAVAAGFAVCAALILAAHGERLAGKTELVLRAAAALAAFAMLLAARLPQLRDRRRTAGGLYFLVAILGISAFYNFGFIRHRNDFSFINYWEHFHYHLGSKYFPELAYDGLYVASVAAQLESDPGRVLENPIRDLRTNEYVYLQFLGPHRDEVLGRFEPKRWREFVADHHRYLAATRDFVIGGIRRDHGYNPTPAWTFTARLFTAHVPATPAGLAFLASLDVVLLGVAFVIVFRTYGAKVGCLCIAICGLAYGWRYMYIGALLRLDWVAASVIGVCMLERRRPALAGALFGYATAVRVFPVLLLFGPGLVAARAWLRGDRDRWALRLGVAFVGVLLAAALAGCLTGRGGNAWPKFFDNIELHRETWPPNRVGIDSLVLYGPRVARVAAREWSTSGSLPHGRHMVEPFEPRETRLAFSARRPLGLALKGAFLVLLAAVVWRLPPAPAASLSVGAIYALTAVESYYWIILVLLPLSGATAASLALLPLAAAMYLVDLYSPGGVSRGVLLASGLGAVLVVALMPRVIRTLRSARA